MKRFHSNLFTTSAFTALAFLFIASATASAADELTVDSEKSTISFVGAKTDGKHEGGFKKFKGTAVADHENPAKSSLSIEIDTRSIWSDDEKLTNHLKSPDFFDVRKFPTVKFESTKIEVTPDSDTSKAKITGKWTMLGKTVEVDVPVVVTMTDQGLNMIADFKIDRTKWGMTYGKGKIDDDVKIQAKLVLKK
ncbi:YceI family protein [Stieleria sp. JC731]|uniref:YceI family protein n=1 Tax=Pirellulaceae TaxID=2691357 RepID=UPI001E59B1D2|nr:YceI family protein [Stieleria sp. JC731]MCC9600376.1 YceI family protein [Stieleria sp. JC731]